MDPILILFRMRYILGDVWFISIKHAGTWLIPSARTGESFRLTHHEPSQRGWEVKHSLVYRISLLCRVCSLRVCFLGHLISGMIQLSVGILYSQFDRGSISKRQPEKVRTCLVGCLAYRRGFYNEDKRLYEGEARKKSNQRHLRSVYQDYHYNFRIRLLPPFSPPPLY